MFLVKKDPNHQVIRVTEGENVYLMCLITTPHNKVIKTGSKKQIFQRNNREVH